MLSKQNDQLEYIQQNVRIFFNFFQMESLDSGMKRTMHKFDKFVQEITVCRYLFIIAILIAIFIFELIILY